MFIVVILSLFVLGDLWWGWHVVRVLRGPGLAGGERRWLRWVVLGVAGGFLVVTVAALAVTMLGRVAGSAHVLPGPLLALVFVWHLVVLPGTLVVSLVGKVVSGVVGGVRGVMSRMSRRTAGDGAAGRGRAAEGTAGSFGAAAAGSEGRASAAGSSGSALSPLSQLSPTASSTSAAPPSSAEGPGLSRRAFLAATAAVLPPVVATVTTGYAMTTVRDFRIRQLTVPIAGLPRDLDGLTIAHLSDTHLGDFTGPRTYRELIDATNGLRADLIVHTGDVINVDADDIPEAMAGLARLEARYGVYVCEGNHDLIQSPGRFWKAVREVQGIRFLRGETADLTARGVDVRLSGIRWAGRRGGQPASPRPAALLANTASPVAPALPVAPPGPDNSTGQALSGRYAYPDGVPLDAADLPHYAACEELSIGRPVGLEAGGPLHVLLAHHPHAFDFAPWAQLTLAGHTHGGQLNVTKRLSPGALMYRYWSGVYRDRERALVVSNGAGNWFPLRVNAPAEIVKLTLRPA